ncbi:MAG TPA: gamma-glutamylcyclotransferase family protein [Opitutaceae bacterium]|jgi:gamma-glutamylcyclotransferase (GGCT)/AIG2-like uncharacterized protein YtfP
MTLVFVYGTLKRGGENHAFLSSGRFAGGARTQQGYALYELDGYPGMVGEAGGPGVLGEVWEVDAACIASLDALEGTSEGLYSRGPVALEGDFANGTVQAYTYLRSVEGRRRLGESWPG